MSFTSISCSTHEIYYLSKVYKKINVHISVLTPFVTTTEIGLYGLQDTPVQHKDCIGVDL